MDNDFLWGLGVGNATSDRSNQKLIRQVFEQLDDWSIKQVDEKTYHLFFYSDKPPIIIDKKTYKFFSKSVKKLNK